MGISELLCNAIKPFDDDIKKGLLSNIVLSGGATMTLGKYILNIYIFVKDF